MVELSGPSPSTDARPQGETVRDGLAPLRPPKLVLTETGHVGQALRAARESLGLDVEDIALVTRVRAPHLAALEAFELDRLPARPFATGYIRAYAMALGLDSEMVVARFRSEAPPEDTALRAPAGVLFDKQRRFRGLAALAGLLIGAVVGWNLLVHAKAPAGRAPRVEAAPGLPSPKPASADPVQLGAPLPAPPEATTPPAYETPGLVASAEEDGSRAAAAARIAATAASAQRPGRPLGAPFTPQGAVYGAPRGGGVVLQALEPTSLVVRGPGGVVYFARQLAAGEAWRAPDLAGLTADVGNPADMEAYVAGRARGPLVQPLTPLAKLTD